MHSQMTSDVEYLFVRLFATCISVLVGCLLWSLVHFSIQLFSYCKVLRVLFIFLVTVLHLMWLLQIFSPSRWLVLFSWLAFTEQKFLILMKSSLSYIWCLSKKSLPYLRSFRFLSMLFSRFTVLCFTFWSVIYFEFIFWKGVWSVSRFFFVCVTV